jgi:hypothetical protein
LRQPVLAVKFPESIWVKSKWKVDELNDQTIEFRLPIDGGIGISCGKGKLQAWSRSRADDSLTVRIEVIQPTGRGPELLQIWFQLGQKCVDRIEPHPDQTVARFQLMMA